MTFIFLLDICGYPGVELTVDGDCIPCEKGFYKSERSQISCEPCPFGYTTLMSGATHINMCSYGRYDKQQGCDSRCNLYNHVIHGST